MAKAMSKVATELRRIPMSREEFERLLEGPPYYDYLNGEAIEVNRPTGRHQHIILRLGNKMWEHVRNNDLGDVYPDVDVLLPTGATVGPDISFLLKEHLERYDEVKGDIVGTPDLVVEVLSPTTAAYERVEKFDEYRKAGVPWVLFVDQDALTVEEFEWRQEGYLLKQLVGTGEVFRPSLLQTLEINLKALLRE